MTGSSLLLDLSCPPLLGLWDLHTLLLATNDWLISSFGHALPSSVGLMGTTCLASGTGSSILLDLSCPSQLDLWDLHTMAVETSDWFISSFGPVLSSSVGPT